MALIAHAEYPAHKHHAGYGKGAAVRKERERKPGHGHESDSHRDVHDNMEKEYRARPHSDESDEGVGKQLAGRTCAPQEQRIEREDKEASCKRILPVLLPFTI